MMNATNAFRFEVARKASRYGVLLIFAATRDLDPEALVETDTLLAHPEFKSVSTMYCAGPCRQVLAM